MSKLILENVTVDELPEQWVRKLNIRRDQRVTVRIETEATNEVCGDFTGAYITNDPAFGIWRDHGAASQVEQYARRLRTSRY